MNMRTLTRADFASCAVYLHPNLVTSARLSRDITNPIRAIGAASGECDRDRFRKVSSAITNILNQISPSVPRTQRIQFGDDLDYLHFSDDWQNCVALAESLLTIEEGETAQLTATCTELSPRSADPCCSIAGLSAAGQCVPRTVAVPYTSYQLNPEASDRCPGGDCLNTYLQDYITAAQSSCVVEELAPTSYLTGLMLVRNAHSNDQ